MRASCTPTGNTLLIPVSPHKHSVLPPLESVDSDAGASNDEDDRIGAIEDEDPEDWDDSEQQATAPES